MTLLTTAQLITNSLRLNGPPPRLDKHIAWPQLVHHADGHGLTPLLYDTWRKAGLLAHVPPAIHDRMAKAYNDNARRNRLTRHDLLDTHQILAEADVPHVVLKGWALVERLYPDPAHRVLYDHDFLVPAEQAERGHQALRAAGLRPLVRKDEWVEKHLTPLWRNDGYRWDGYLFDPDYPRPVELHIRLWEQGWRGLRVRQLPRLWMDVQTRMIAGVPVQTLSDENTLVHLAMHFAGHLVEGDGRLNQLFDLTRWVAMLSTSLDWEYVLDQATQANVGRFVYASLFLANQIFAAPLPPANIWRRLAAATPPALRGWLAQHGPAAVLTADYRRPHQSRAYHLTFLAANSMVERLSIVRFAALPPVEQLVIRYNLPHRWLGPLFYPRYVIERVGSYSRGWLLR